jgi:hypothetical protein
VIVVPEGVVLAYAAALVLSGVMLVVFGAVGFGQGALARAVQILGGLAFFAYAGYLLFVDQGEFNVVGYVFTGPFIALGNIIRVRRARQLAADQLAATYIAEAQDRARGRYGR